jgi:hypothetical protein
MSNARSISAFADHKPGQPQLVAGKLSRHFILRRPDLHGCALRSHHKSGAVFFTDLIQQLPTKSLAGWRAVGAKWDLMLGPEPSARTERP